MLFKVLNNKKIQDYKKILYEFINLNGKNLKESYLKKLSIDKKILKMSGILSELQKFY